MTAVETIRKAAALMRERAEKAAPGPWRVVVSDSEKADVVAQECRSPEHPVDQDPGRDYMYDCCRDGEMHGEFGFYREHDAEHIASWHPQVAVAVADWLEDAAAYEETQGRFYADAKALAVARTYLGRAEQ